LSRENALPNGIVYAEIMVDELGMA